MDSIPWRLGESTEISLWIWETEHFRAKIQTDSYRVNFLWDIVDYSQGTSDPLTDGYTGSFSESEEMVREIIGKSYPPMLGYSKYAGRFATTFTIFNKDKIDFGPMIASKVIITVRVADKQGKIREKKIVGKLGVENYTVKVSPEHGNPIRIPPSRIISVKQEFGGMAKPIQKEDLGRTLRIFPGDVTRGCTGKPGFMPNTVEHTSRAERCPIHEAK